MSKVYEKYLEDHIANVTKAFYWMVDHDILEFLDDDEIESYYKIILNHDHSKYSEEEYEAYDRYFYPDEYEDNLIFSERRDQFDRAWLHHIHVNPHHWQHWVYMNDDGTVKALRMETPYVIEMICDWWSFSIKKGDLTEIFSWYKAHKDGMMLHPVTRVEVELILMKMKAKLLLGSDSDDI